VKRSAGWLAALLAGPVCAGCLGVRPSELPSEPIAFTYRAPEEARRRAEDMLAERARGREPERVNRPGYNDMYATADGVVDYLSRVLGRTQGEDDRYPGRLALLDPRSGELTVVSAARRGSIPLDWSADHQRLLFAQPGEADFQIYEYEREQRTVRPVTYGPPAHTQGCYAADGRVLVAAVDTRASPQQSHLELSERGGRHPFRAISEGPADHSPTCAPDGDLAVFVRELGGGRAEIRSVRLDDPSAASQPLSPGQHPRFSYDGEWVAFAAPYQRQLRIWRIRPDGSGRAPIGRGVRNEARPTFSPDGRVVVYVAAEDLPRRHLYLRRFDGSGDRILFADGDGEYPVW